MSKITRAFPSAKAAVDRRKFLCVAPSAVTAATMPLGTALPRQPSHPLSIQARLAALWNREEAPTCVKPTSAARIDAFVAGHDVGLISASRSDLTPEENRDRSILEAHAGAAGEIYKPWEDLMIADELAFSSGTRYSQHVENGTM